MSGGKVLASHTEFGADKRFKRNPDKRFSGKNAAFDCGMSLNREASIYK